MSSFDAGQSENTCSRYLADLGQLLKKQAMQAREEARVATDADRLFQQGRLLAYHEVVSLMQQQAKVFGIPLRSIGLEGLDAEADLL